MRSTVSLSVAGTRLLFSNSIWSLVSMDHDICISHTNDIDAVAFLQNAGYEYHRNQVVTRASLGDKPWLQSKGIGPNFILDEHAAPVNSRYLEEGVDDVLDLH